MPLLEGRGKHNPHLSRRARGNGARGRRRHSRLGTPRVRRGVASTDGGAGLL